MMKLNIISFTKLFHLICTGTIGFLCISCNPTKNLNQDFLYFQRGADSMGKAMYKDLDIQPNDVLQIEVFSKTLNQDQASIFNFSAKDGFLVDMQGMIDFPVLGSIKAAGMTRRQLTNNLTVKLEQYVKEPSVIVRFQQFKINVLGEVKGPGLKTFTTDKVTIIDAISNAGDLTEYGKREDIMVIRELPDGSRKVYPIDLRSAAVFHSPAFQLQQNDVVYVGANNQKLKSLKPRKEWRGVQIGSSILAVATSLFFIITRK